MRKHDKQVRATSTTAATANHEKVKLFLAAAYKETDNGAVELTVILRMLSITKIFTRRKRRWFTVD